MCTVQHASNWFFIRFLVNVFYWLVAFKRKLCWAKVCCEMRTAECQKYQQQKEGSDDIPNTGWISNHPHICLDEQRICLLLSLQEIHQVWSVVCSVGDQKQNSVCHLAWSVCGELAIHLCESCLWWCAWLGVRERKQEDSLNSHLYRYDRKKMLCESRCIYSFIATF